MVSDGTNLKMELLRFLERGGHQRDTRLSILLHYIREDFPGSNPSEVMEQVWEIIRQGFAFLNFSQSAATNWSLHLTDIGREVVRQGEWNPYDFDSYLKRLREMVPQASEVVLEYTKEALICFSNQCYLACSVMLGVASEAAFLELADALGVWLPNKKGEVFRDILSNTKKNYIAKFTEFRKRIEPIKSEIPAELADGMELTLNSVLDLLRIYRNESGHPTRKFVRRDDAFIHLQMFARYLQKMYLLRDFFIGEKSQASAEKQSTEAR